MAVIPQRKRYLMIILAPVILFLNTGFLLRDVRAYKQAGARRSDVNVAQVREIAASTDFTARWIRLTEPLDLKCSQSLGWEENGKTSIAMLAFDQSQQQPFWLVYDGNPTCEEFKSVPMEGLLVPPDKFWTTHGMVKPSAVYPLVELKVGASPADLRKDVYTWTGADLFAIGLLVAAYITRPRKRTPSPFATVRPENAWSASGSGKR